MPNSIKIKCHAFLFLQTLKQHMSTARVHICTTFGTSQIQSCFAGHKLWSDYANHLLLCLCFISHILTK